MQKSIIIGETTIHIGNKLRANKNAEIRDICSCDEIVEVKAIKVEDRTYIGLYSENKHKAWGSLDGTVGSYHGVWQDAEGLFNFFDLIYRDKVVTTDYYFKKRSLKGMKCKVLYQNHRQGQCFVEFNENVGGGSADGLGKMGHCVVLPSVLLENMEEFEEKKVKAKKKVIEKKDAIVELSKDTESKAGRWLDQPVLSDADSEKWEKAARDLWRVDEIGFLAQGHTIDNRVNQWKEEHLVHVPKKSKTVESVEIVGTGEPIMISNGYVDFGEEPDFFDES